MTCGRRRSGSSTQLALAACGNKVFGAGKTPPIHKPENIVGGVWEKPGSQLADGSKLTVKMAYDDREIAKAGGRVFENANPFTLKNNIYTFMITDTGITSFGNPVDYWEVGTRHAHLSQGRPVVASGELVKSNAGIRLNMLSGTYMIPMVQANRIDPAKMGTAIQYWFDKVLRQKYHPPESFKVTFGQSGKGTFANDKIFETERAKGKPRLPFPSLCQIKKVTKLCDARFKFASRNAELCQKVAAATCP